MRVRCVVALVSRANKWQLHSFGARRKGRWLRLAATSLISLRGEHFTTVEEHLQSAEALVHPNWCAFVKSRVCFPQEEMHWSHTRRAPKTRNHSGKSPLFTFSNPTGCGRGQELTTWFKLGEIQLTCNQMRKMKENELP